MISAVNKLNQSEWRWVLIGGLIAFALGSLFLQGCSQSPFKTETASSDNGLSRIEALEQAVDPSGPSMIRSVQEEEVVSAPVIVGSDCVEGTFGPDGGTMTAYIDTEEVLFVIPPGALSEDVLIRICGYKGVDELGQVNFLYDCSPTGLQFAQPMVLHQPWPFGGSSVNSFFLSDDPGAVWTLEEVAPVTNNQTLINIHHFSKYGISN